MYKKRIKPNVLKPGDKVATVSLSWGGAGEPDIRWRYEIGKKRLETIFGLEVVEMPHTLSGEVFLYEHPEKRAEDLMMAFKDPEIKGIISCIGGSESIRLLPYIDYDVIKNNPKIFMGYSDTTIAHLMCFKAGLSSFYGPALLVDFAENVEMDAYTVEAIKHTLFDTKPVGKIEPPEHWTSMHLPWLETNKDIRRTYMENEPYICLQGRGSVSGHLIGGCMEVLEFAKGTSLFPEVSDFEGAILFLETSEETPSPDAVEYWLRNYAAMGILEHLNGIVIAKPYRLEDLPRYLERFKKVLKEYQLTELPVLANLSFGHTEPKFIMPYGAIATIDCDQKTFEIETAATCE